ncbi:MAG: class I SAM-dependent RNA methyltransferase, partial [Anaerolineales bacterium]
KIMIDTVDVRIDNLVYGGDALGRLADGRVVFVQFANNGEMVRVRLVEDKPRHARAEMVEVLEPSPERVNPRCQHFTTCGGCHYQQMNYPNQLKVKAAILREQLERIGGLRDFPAVEIEAAPEPLYYRNHIQFHLTNEGKLGFQKAHSNQPFAIRECHLPEVTINQLWPQIEIEPISGLERVSLRLGAEEDMMLILASTDPQVVDFSIEDVVISVVQVGPAGSMVLAGSDHLVMDVLGRRFKVSAASFFQVNTLQAQAMVKHLTGHLPLKEDMTVLDVYSGVGLYSAFLAPKVKRLVGIEISPDACEDFVTNLDEFDHVELYEAPVEDVLTSINFTPDLIVMDPPRAGLGVKTIEGVLAQGAAHLAYISCDPATLARDSNQLVAGGYSLERLTLFDMFPQTYHIESISFWEKD